MLACSELRYCVQDQNSLQLTVSLCSLLFFKLWNNLSLQVKRRNDNYSPGVDFTKGFKTWHKFSTEIRFRLIPIIVLFIAHEFITGNF